MKIKEKDLLSNKMEQTNNFYLLRFICAFLVVFSHSFDLLGLKTQEWYRVLTNHNIISAGYIGVFGFFFISGFLITKSWMNSSGILSYIKKRVLRIYPALFVVVFLTMFILGPIITNVDLKTYFTSPHFKNYFSNFLMLKYSFYLDGVFINNPNNMVNGSFWTLPSEIKCYILTIVFGLFSFYKKRFFILLVIFLGLFFFSAKLILYLFFFIGQAFYLYKDKIILNKYLAIIALLIFILTQPFFILSHFLNFLILPYLIIYVTFNTKHINIEKYGDFSYGLYIYAFPVQQMLIQYFGFYLNPYNLLLYSFLITFLFAFLSWHLIEKKALGLKNVNILDKAKTYLFKK